MLGLSLIILSNCVTQIDKTHIQSTQSREAYGSYYAVRSISWLTIHVGENRKGLKCTKNNAAHKKFHAH